jgi:hemerythrin
MSEQLLWKPEYSVGNDEIDRQHQYLFDLCRMLSDVKERSDSPMVIFAALNSLFDYAKIHFQFEENLLHTHLDPGAHRLLHRDFLEKVDDFMMKYEQKQLRLQEIRDFITSWIIHHILEEDRNIFRRLREAGDQRSTPTPERRKTVRRLQKRPIVFRTEQTIVETVMDLRDLSPAGAFVELQEGVAPGTRCSIELPMELGGEEKVLLLEGEVVRREKRGVGIAFKEPDAASATLLQVLLSGKR